MNGLSPLLIGAVAIAAYLLHSSKEKANNPGITEGTRIGDDPNQPPVPDASVAVDERAIRPATVVAAGMQSSAPAPSRTVVAVRNAYQSVINSGIASTYGGSGGSGGDDDHLAFDSVGSFNGVV